MTHKRRQLSNIKARLLVLISLMVVSAPGFAAPLNISISSDQPSYQANQAISVHFKISNPASNKKTMKFVPWKTPLEGRSTANSFAIYGSGKRLKYLGRTTKRAKPRADQFISLSPGESITASVDLSRDYAFTDMGGYSVQFRSELLYLHEAGTQAVDTILPTQVQSNTIMIELTETRVQLSRVAESATFSGCTGNQQSMLDAAHTRATSLSLIARNDLQNTPTEQRPTAARYKQWFGTFSTARYNKAENGFVKMYDAFANQDVKYLCDCTAQDENEGIIAFVFPGQHYEIHICQSTFNQPVTGSDTQAGTLIHEMSHFSITVATDDHVYGKLESQALAISSPTNALDNAENYLFFAENTPFLAMSRGNGSAVVPPIYLLLN